MSKTVVEQHELYGGKVILDYWPASHKYVVDGNRKIGVTTITGVIHKESLMTWPLYEAINYLKGFVIDTSDLGKGMFLSEEMLDEASKQYKKKQLRGTDVGTIAHDWLELYLRAIKDGTKAPDKLEPIPLPDEQYIDEYIRATDWNNVIGSIDLFIDWINDNDVEVLEVEKIIYSKEHDYCGRFDAILKINGKVYVIDFKTSNPSRDFQEGIYPENFAQLGGYDIAFTEEFPDFHIDGHAIFNLSKKAPLINISYSEDRQLNRDFFLFCLGTKRGMQFHTNRLKWQDQKTNKTKGESK